MRCQYGEHPLASSSWKYHCVNLLAHTSTFVTSILLYIGEKNYTHTKRNSIQSMIWYSVMRIGPKWPPLLSIMLHEVGHFREHYSVCGHNALSLKEIETQILQLELSLCIGQTANHNIKYMYHLWSKTHSKLQINQTITVTITLLHVNSIMCYEIALTCKILTTSNILLCGSVCIFETTKICLQENILGPECILLAYMIAKRIKISWVSNSWKKWMLLHRITISRLVSTAFIVNSFQQQNSHEVSSFRICYTRYKQFL